MLITFRKPTNWLSLISMQNTRPLTVKGYDRAKKSHVNAKKTPNSSNSRTHLTATPINTINTYSLLKNKSENYHARALHCLSLIHI